MVIRIWHGKTNTTWQCEFLLLCWQFYIATILTASSDHGVTAQWMVSQNQLISSSKNLWLSISFKKALQNGEIIKNNTNVT